jgi:hypothetical protein
VRKACPEEILLDQNKEAAPSTYMVGGLQPRHQRLAYLRLNGSEKYTIFATGASALSA